MNKNKKLITTLFILILSFCAYGQSLRFNSQDIYGQTVSDSIFSNSELTMVNIWGTFCGPCIREMPDLGKLNNSYSKDKFQVVGIVIDAVNRGVLSNKVVADAKIIVEKTEANYVHIIPDASLNNGFLKNVYAVPTTLFVDKTGKIVGKVYTGSRSFTDWKTIIDELLK